MVLPGKRRGGRDPVDARKKLEQLLEDWAQDHWPLCISTDEREDEQLYQQGQAWLLDQIERWHVDLTPSRSHKLKFFGGKTVARWGSLWSSGVDLVANYRQARLDGTLPEAQRAAELIQALLDRFSQEDVNAQLAKAERCEADLLQQLTEATAKVDGLAGKVRQCHLDERAAWDQWLLQSIPEGLDLRQQQEARSDLHRQAMKHTEKARQKYLTACKESQKALDKQAELQELHKLAVDDSTRLIRGTAETSK